ncbi:hypothetical protein [Phytobacter sp. AG2a]|jgi:hypothetical protein
MHTHNVNVKTAAQETAGRWGENRMELAVSDQQGLLTYLESLKKTRMLASHRAEQVLGTLLRMAENVLYPGITDWSTETPRASFRVMQPWIQARAVAENLFGETGVAAWEIARKHIADSVAAERHMP